MKFLLLLLIPFSIISQDVPTRGAIYDFDIGDEFHYFSSQDGDCYIFGVDRLTILDKYFSLSNDTVFYIFERQSYWSAPIDLDILDTFYNVSIDTSYYTNLEAKIDSMESLAGPLDSVDIFTYDTIMWCNNTLVRFDWCYRCSMLGSSTHIKHFGIGLGRVYEVEISSGFQFTRPILVYANKVNSGECGERDDRILNTHYELAESLEIYPNPTSDYLLLSEKIDVDQILCFDHSGKLVCELKSVNYQLDVSFLPNGQYIILLVKDQLFSSKKFTKIDF